MAQVSINSDLGEWGSSIDSGERARLLQSPCVDTAPKSEGEASPEGLGRGTTSTLGAIFIVVNACLGAGLLNFPAAFSTAGGVAAGVALQMVSVLAAPVEIQFRGWGKALDFIQKGGFAAEIVVGDTCHLCPHPHPWQTVLINSSIFCSEPRGGFRALPSSQGNLDINRILNNCVVYVLKAGPCLLKLHAEIFTGEII